MFFSGQIFSDAPGWTFKRPVDVSSDNIWIQDYNFDTEYKWELKGLTKANFMKLNFDYIYTDYPTEIWFESDDIIVDPITGDNELVVRTL